MRYVLISTLSLIILIQWGVIKGQKSETTKWEQAAEPIFNAYNPRVGHDPETLEHILKYAQPPGSRQKQRGPRYGDCVPLKWD